MTSHPDCHFNLCGLPSVHGSTRNIPNLYVLVWPWLETKSTCPDSTPQLNKKMKKEKNNGYSQFNTFPRYINSFFNQSYILTISTFVCSLCATPDILLSLGLGKSLNTMYPSTRHHWRPENWGSAVANQSDRATTP